ncbi:Domain of uncharacterised function (DUF1937) [Leminorella richardii]|uniref:Domain of uncharacterized function (DUF1937) n=1 Tax=Leminorella richardii TaxID=158841 RepID=A0A2X4VCZ6_9GAMM|nr:DUF1937 family protein [Leminorella richardii]SQI43150.1 Domain of uncharacterised function (DUF1937) [Leminorella richardii]
MKLYFIACPYSDADPEVVIRRFNECTEAAAALSLAGHAVYSQITMTHPINEAVARAGKKIVWSPIDEAYMARCDEIIVLTLPGWEKSGGVAAEIDYFKSRGKKVWTYEEFTKAHGVPSL